MTAKAKSAFSKLQEVLDKDPVTITLMYLELRPEITTLITTSGLKLEEIAKGLGMTRQSLNRRMKQPEGWEPEELIKLYKLLGIKAKK